MVLDKSGFIKQFFLFCFFGLSSLLLDTDHILGLVQQGREITWQNLSNGASRILHIPVFIFCWFISFYILAHVLGLYYVTYRDREGI